MTTSNFKPKDIKYYTCSLSFEQGWLPSEELDSWDPDGDYGDEYAEVNFEMSYNGHPFSWSTEVEDTDILKNDLTNIGLNTDDKDGFVCIDDVVLHLHRTGLSADMRKDKIKQVAEILATCKRVHLDRVKILYDVFVGTEDEYRAYLETKKEDIMVALFEIFRTKRRNLFIQEKFLSEITSACKRQAGIIDRIEHPCCRDELTIKFVQNCIYEMADCHLLVEQEIRGYRSFRALNKVESAELLKQKDGDPNSESIKSIIERNEV